MNLNTSRSHLLNSDQNQMYQLYLVIYKNSESGALTFLQYVDALRHRASRVLGKHRSVRAGTVVVQGDSKICVTLQGKTFHDIRDMSLMNPTRENGCGLFAADSYFPLLVGLFVSG